MKKSDWEIIDDILNQFKELETDNKINHLKTEHKTVRALDNTIYKFTSLSVCLLKNRGNRPLRLNYVEMFLSSIVNNAIVIKNLYISGWHLQCQSIMRVQYELLNNVIAILVDVDFFQRFQKIQKLGDKEIPISPKHNDSKRVIRKFLEKEEGKELWLTIESHMDYLYKELSRAIHSNFFHVAMLSIDRLDDDNIYPGIGGNKNSLPRMNNSVEQMNNYSQFLWLFIKELLLELKAFEIKDTVFELEFMKNPIMIDSEKNGIQQNL